MDLKAWKKQVARLASDLAGVDDILAEDDPYDLAEVMQDSYDEDLTPEDFVQEHFADDIASRAALDVEAEDGLIANSDYWDDDEIDLGDDEPDLVEDEEESASDLEN
jgi:hypothetical protein